MMTGRNSVIKRWLSAVVLVLALLTGVVTAGAQGLLCEQLGNAVRHGDLVEIGIPLEKGADRIEDKKVGNNRSSSMLRAKLTGWLG